MSSSSNMVSTSTAVPGRAWVAEADIDYGDNDLWQTVVIFELDDHAARHSPPPWPGPATARRPGPARRRSPQYGYRDECPRPRPGPRHQLCSLCFLLGAMLERRHRPGEKLPRQSCDGSRPARTGQAPDQANEGGQAGAGSRGDTSLERHANRRSGPVRVTRRHHHPPWPAPAPKAADTDRPSLTGISAHAADGGHDNPTAVMSPGPTGEDTV
jgi:hypothetical protein